ncbi:MAG: plasminogen-binding N-terminal domain-containing protein [Arcobacteraceae bacterium]|nr:plasminogen-binding N-terminal domain-containing protein [Arcobacteraceae bacterium]
MRLILTIFLSFLVASANQFTQQNTTISNVTKDSATIQIGSLEVGQSGIVVHNFKNDKSTILTNAIVTSSAQTSSIITFEDSKILEQSAIPTTSLKPSNGDVFILNHLYNTSLLIVPNQEAKIKIKKKYSNNNFIDIDIFASFLKINDTPIPKKEDITNFSKHNNIGTVYIQAENQLHIVDVLSFKVIKSESLKVDCNKTQSPFFTNVQDIRTPFFSWFAKERIDNYDKYYTNLIGINNDRK